MLAVPVVEAENVTWQDAVPRVPATRPHGLPVNVPVTPVWLNVTVPVGVICVPGLVVGSLTTAVHVVDTPVATLVGEQLTVVFVGRVLTTMLVVPWLPL
jgi:hypothetical protein